LATDFLPDAAPKDVSIPASGCDDDPALKDEQHPTQFIWDLSAKFIETPLIAVSPTNQK
jgi:hypothetical protein